MITLEFRDTLALLHMDDGKANAMNEAFLGQLNRCLDEAIDASALVIRGRPGFFSGGLDLKTLPGLAEVDFLRTVNLFEAVMRKVLAFPRPTLAQVEGHAMAGGAVLLLCCDQALAAPGSYRIGLNEVAIGLPLPEFVLQLGRSRLQPTAHRQALLLGRAYGPEEALKVGYLEAVFEDLEPQVLERARTASQLSPLAYGYTKALLNREVAAVPEGQLASAIGQGVFSQLGRVLRK